MAWVLSDNSFESHVTGSFVYGPGISGTAWTFDSSSGLSNVTGGFNVGAIVDGNQCAFIQGGVSGSTIYQSVSGIPAGIYTISWYQRQRPSGNASTQTFNLLVDGGVINSYDPTVYVTFLTVTSSQFHVAGGSHEIRFTGTNTHGGDNTILLDLVTVNQISLDTLLFRAPTLSLGGAGRFAQTGVNG
jgi:hypothetical protein